jgi:hypothetical protein
MRLSSTTFAGEQMFDQQLVNLGRWFEPDFANSLLSARMAWAICPFPVFDHPGRLDRGAALLAV